MTNSDNVKYWEIGNEVYGNGTYGANWETDSHCDTSLNGSPVTIGSEPSQTYNCGPTQYAANVLAYTSAIHAVDPSAKVCAVLTTPGFWPDGVTNSEYPQSWNQTVLTALGSQTQCVIVHYYPGGTTAAGMLTDPQDIPGIMSTLHSEISQYAGISNAASVPVIVTETNSTIDMDTQPGALFTADLYMTWLENGASNVNYWDEHNGIGTVSTVDGATDYGDSGMFSNASSGSGSTEPAAETPFAPYYAAEMLTKLGSPGDTLVTSTSSNALVRVHAVRRAGGSLDVLIDNEDPSNAYTVNLAYNGFTPSGSPTVYTYGLNGTSITSATGSSSSSVTVQPYSLTVIQLPGSGGTGVTAPGAPGQPVASGLSSSTSGSTSGVATLTWPAAAAGTYPVADYQVYQQGSGGSTTLTGTTTGTTLSLSGLTVGASYTYDVVAVDSQGNTSLPSPPVTFTVPPPANSSCAVHYAVSSSWPGGFGAAITITNKGSTALSPWTLTFTFPAAGEAVQGGWNGTWSQSGEQVTVNAASWNASIPANGGIGEHRVQRHRHRPGSGPDRPVRQRDGLRERLTRPLPAGSGAVRQRVDLGVQHGSGGHGHGSLADPGPELGAQFPRELGDRGRLATGQVRLDRVDEVAEIDPDVRADLAIRDIVTDGQGQLADRGQRGQRIRRRHR